MSQFQPSQFPGQFAPEPPRPSSGGKAVLYIILGLLGVVGLICCGCIGFFGWAGMRFGPPTFASLGEAMRVSDLPVVRNEIGDMTEPPQQIGQPQFVGDTMRAGFRLNGTKGSADVTIEVEKQGADWIVKSSTVRLPNGKTIDAKSAPDAVPPGPPPPDATMPDAEEADEDAEPAIDR